MKNTTKQPFDQRIERNEFLQVLQFSLDAKLFRFVRQACQLWLASYPGDLEIQLIHARSLRADAKTLEATLIVERIFRHDPEDIDAIQFLEQLYIDLNRPEKGIMQMNIYALSGSGKGHKNLSDWSVAVHQSILAMQKGLTDDALRLVYPALGAKGDPIIAAIQHARITHQSNDPHTMLHLVEIYHTRWPECLQFGLWLAECQMQQGVESSGVSLLHHCAAEDTTGKVARRIFGDNHPYEPIWPVDLRIRLDIPIPAAVATHFGWNSLSSGSSGSVESQEGESPAYDSIENENIEQGHNRAEEPPAGYKADAKIVQPEPEVEVFISTDQMVGDLKNKVELPNFESKEHINEIQAEFEDIARRLKKPGLGRADGRFPQYVILTCRENTREKYGNQTEEVIYSELNRLAEAVRAKSGWGSVIFSPDDEDCLNRFNLAPLDGIDPWNIKLAIADLDRSLGVNGEMVGAILIVGGDEIVPFHRLPNPTDDSDIEVLSDNPYATLDGNYFIPEWPVGRLVGEKGTDASLLLDQIRQITAEHNGIQQEEPGFWIRFNDLIRRGTAFSLLFGNKDRNSNYGLTAAVWQRSSVAAFRPIGSGNHLVVSPPAFSSIIDEQKIKQANLGYFNLHGLADSPEWYGQRDPQETTDGPDYPIALTPENLRKNGHSPRFVFSEACYGGYVVDKSENDSIALKLTGIGTRGLIASTSISYGSIASPLIGADLLGNLFWRFLKEGYSSGESLLKAKIEVAREMNRRQGFLDGEDQKTIISFLLLGDPLASYENRMKHDKNNLRFKKENSIKTVCDIVETSSAAHGLGREVIAQVKEMVESYLPGVEGATVTVHEQQSGTYTGKGTNLSPERIAKTNPGKTDNLKITVCKEIKQAQHIHKQYARVTINPDGKMVKLTVSR